METQLEQTVANMEKRIVELETRQAEHLQMIQALRESEEKYRILLDESSDPTFAFYADGEYRYVNQAFADGVGKPRDEIIGKKIWDVFPQDEADKRFAAVKWVFENGKTKVIEVRVPRPDGDRYYITTAKPVVNDEGKVISVICVSKEITERKRMEQQLEHLSTHDILTGLYNRNFFETELARIQPSRQYPVSIIIIDMDNLKIVNDQYGHITGDELIRKVAEFLQQTCRVEDIVARIGGDEFAILLPNTSEQAAQTLVDRLHTRLQNQPDPRIQVSMGCATGVDKSSLIEVMRLADDRMYQEKATHRNQINKSTLDQPT